MQDFPIGFTKCPSCQKYSINILPAFGFSKNQIADWQCPYCFLILEDENWKKNIVSELKENLEEERENLLFGKILTHETEELSPQKAKELAANYIKNLKIKELPPDLKSAKVSDYVEEWQVDFKKIIPKGAVVIPDSYCIVVNKKNGQILEISPK
jgi:hypothetical protein